MLGDAINAAVADISDEGLGFALGKDAQGKYVGLHLHKSVEPRFGTGAMLVRNGIARAQLESDGTGPIALPSKPTGPGVPRPNPPGPQARPKPKRFVGAIELDALRGLAKAGQVFESIINELDRTPGTKFRITLEVTATSDAGFPEDVEDVVKDNAATLGFAEKRFD